MPTVPIPDLSVPGVASTIDVCCPADGRLVGTVPKFGSEEVRVLAGGLRAAQPAWEDLGPEGRRRHLLAWLDWFFDNRRRLGELIQEESGKAWNDAVLEVLVVAEIIHYYTRHGARFLARRRVRPHSAAGLTKSLSISYRPFPLVGLITPWNVPLGTPVLDGVAALMAGAAVLTKPSEYAPLAWAEAVRGWREDVGAPPIMACATGDATTGEAVVDEVDMVMFTGSTGTGRKIAARAAARLIPCSLELGGKDAMIVLADADIDRAAAAATWGAMTNSGQACISVERVYVEEPVYDEFLQKVTGMVSALRLGMDRPDEFVADVGAVVTAAQVGIVEDHVRDAVAKGARVMTGGRRLEANFFEPTVLTDVDHTMTCMRDETFGPTLPIMRVRSEAEAIRLANDSTYGLSASVWTQDRARGERVAAQLQVGAVNINDVMTNLFQFALPQGGWKQSGVGTRLGGADGMLKFCRPQAQVADRFGLSSEPHWFPASRRKGSIQWAVVRLLRARGWKRRVGLRADI